MTKYSVQTSANRPRGTDAINWVFDVFCHEGDGTSILVLREKADNVDPGISFEMGLKAGLSLSQMDTSTVSPPAPTEDDKKRYEFKSKIVLISGGLLAKPVLKVKTDAKLDGKGWFGSELRTETTVSANILPSSLSKTLSYIFEQGVAVGRVLANTSAGTAVHPVPTPPPIDSELEKAARRITEYSGFVKPEAGSDDQPYRPKPLSLRSQRNRSTGDVTFEIAVDGYSDSQSSFSVRGLSGTERHRIASALRHILAKSFQAGRCYPVKEAPTPYDPEERRKEIKFKLWTRSIAARTAMEKGFDSEADLIQEVRMLKDRSGLSLYQQYLLMTDAPTASGLPCGWTNTQQARWFDELIKEMGW